MNFLEDILPEGERPSGYADVLGIALALVANSTGRVGQDSQVILIKIIRQLDGELSNPFVATSKLRELVGYAKPENRSHTESLFQVTANFSRKEKANILLNCLKVSTICLGEIEHHVHSVGKIGKLMHMDSRQLLKEIGKATNLIEHDFSDFISLFENAQRFSSP